MPHGECVVLISGYKDFAQAGQGVEEVRRGINVVPLSPIQTAVEADLTDRVLWICRLREEAELRVGKNLLKKVFHKCKDRFNGEGDDMPSQVVRGQMIVVSGLPERAFALLVAAELAPHFLDRLVIAREEDLECARIIEGLPAQTLNTLISMLQYEAARRHRVNVAKRNTLSNTLIANQLLLEEEGMLE